MSDRALGWLLAAAALSVALACIASMNLILSAPR